MDVKWTPNQKQAIEARGTNLLVSAAAGSGKTAVLVERVQRMILGRELEINELLITTFTKAAADEMGRKLQEALTKKLDENPEDGYLQRQLALFEHANIGTIHSMCQILIRNYAYKLGLSSAFAIADQSTTVLLKKQAYDTVLEQAYEQNEEGFLSLIDGYGGDSGDDALADIVFGIYSFAASTPDPVEWLDQCRKLYKAGYCSRWADTYIALQKTEIAEIVSEYDRMISMAEPQTGYEKYPSALLAEQKYIAALLPCSDWNSIRAACIAIDIPRIPSRGKGSDETVGEYVKGKRAAIKDSVKAWLAVYCAPYEEILDEIAILSKPMTALCDFIEELHKEFSRLKREKNLLDFSDLEHFTIKLLQTDADDIGGRYKQILIDEFQDTNSAQAAIFDAIGQEDNVFVVGDVKQSIYRFRNAQPQLFIEKSGKYQNGSGGKNVFLSNNFRSGQAVIDAVNHIFSRLMSKTLGEVDYGEQERLIYSNDKIDNSFVELNIIQKPLPEDVPEEYGTLSTRTCEAIELARHIVRLVEVERVLVYDKEIKSMRPVRYSDITILARSANTASPVYAAELTRFGVPVYSESKDGYFASIEISTVLSLLRVLDNPLQDVPLVAVLRSPMFLFDDAQLAELRCIDKRKNFYSLLSENENEKCRYACKKIRDYMTMSRYLSLEGLIRYVIADTGYEAYAAAMPNSDIRIQNLRLLCERAAEFESTGYKSLHEFIGYVSEMLASNEDYTVAKVVSENDNAVRIMSIHKSKGLEFPIVFLVDCAHRFNKKDASKPVLYDLELGIGADIIDPDRRIKYPNISKQSIALKKKYETLSEELRILYVALTRPIHRLYIYGCVKDIDKAKQKWSDNTSPFYMAGLGSLLDWISLGVQGLSIPTNYLYPQIEEEEIRTNLSAEIRRGAGEVDAELYKDIDRALSYKYPEQGDYLPLKVSVSQLVRSDDEPISLKTPLFLMEENKTSAMSRGTTTHFVMQNIDVSKTESVTEIELQLRVMTEGNMLSEELAETVDIASIYRFFSSKIGQRLKKSPNIQREMQFLVEFKASEIYNDDKDSRPVLVQGAIDCCFEEEGELVIVDYKTGSIEHRKEQYEKQLLIYKQALEQVTGKKVKEQVLYKL